MSETSKAFMRELIKIIVDKLLIGGIVLLIAVLANDFADKLKSQRSFSAEINRTRVEKIAEVWEKIGSYEGELYIRTQAVLELWKVWKRTDIGGKEFDKATTAWQNASHEKQIEMKKSHDDVLRILNKNRLWLGEENYKQISNYLDLNDRILSLYKDEDPAEKKELEKQRDEARANILRIRDTLFTEQ